ncbi:MAG: hypothetical protein AAGI68_03880 [Planctomycetota bacterium]
MNFAKTQTKAHLSRLGIAAALGFAILAGTSAAAEYQHPRLKMYGDKAKHAQTFHTGHTNTHVRTVHHHHHHQAQRHHDNRFGWRYKHTNRDYRCTTHRPITPRRHWVPGYWTQQYIPPVYSYRYDPCGTRHRVIVRSGYHKKVWVSGRWTTSYRHTRAYTHRSYH